MIGPMQAKFKGIADIVNSEFPGQYLPIDTVQQINTANGQQVKGEIIEQSITPIYMMPTPQTQELMDSNNGPHYLMQAFQQRNIHDPNVYTECRFTSSDHPPQRTIGDHQLLNHQSDTVWNDMFLQPNNASTPFQTHNQNPTLVQQQAQLDPSDTVVQHLQQQALNQSQLNDTLGSILSSQQNLQWEMVSVMNINCHKDMRMSNL